MNKPREIPSAALARGLEQSRTMSAQLGREITSPLASALERVTSLKVTGKIRRNGLQALREEIEQALRAGTAAQQLCQVISQDPQPRPQRLDLKAALCSALALLGSPQPAESLDARGQTGPALVTADPRLTERLLTALVQWAMGRGEGPARWSVETGHGEFGAKLVCLVKLREPALDEAGLWTIDWRLVDALSGAMGARLLRRDDDGLTSVAIEWSRAAEAQSIDGLLVEELDSDQAMDLYSRALAGASLSLLIVAGRRETRELIEESVKPLGLVTHFASSVEQTREFCQASVPQVIVHEPRVRGVPFEPLRIQLLARAPTLTTVEIFDEDAEESVHHDIRPRRRMRRQSVARDLLPLLMNELTQTSQS